MGTSKSTESSDGYIAGALIFSGRPDPAWAVSASVAARLMKIWDSMGPHDGAAPTAPVLGYRGCFLKDSKHREWFAYKGVVTLKTPEGNEARKDEGRKFESLLLSSAPEGAIPRQIIDAEFGR